MSEIPKVSGENLPIHTLPHHLFAGQTPQHHNARNETLAPWEKPLFVERRTHTDRRHDEHNGGKALFDTRQTRDRRKSAVIDYDA